MRILYLVPYAPTPIRTRPYNLIRALARRGHRITVATLWEDAAERGALVELRAQGIEVLAAPLTPVQKVWNLLHALPTRTPLQAAYCWQPALAEAVVSRQLSEGSDRPFDVVHVEHLRGAPYGLYLKSPMLNTQYPIPVVWDSVDCISYLFEQAARDSRSLQGRLMTRLELTRTRRYEGWLVGQFDRVLVTSPVDQEALTQLHQTMRSQEDKGTGRQGDGLPLSLSPSLPLTVLPNGVDLSYFAPDDTPRDPATVLFSGKMSYHANVTAALHLVHDIMPLVWEERPEAKVIIAGKDPPSEIRNLDSAMPETAGHAVRNPKSAIRNVTVTGTIPDLRPYLRSATVAVSPLLYGAGIQNKVLEAMACGTPVVASSQAVSALQTTDGEDLLVASDAETFAHHILAVLGDRSLAQRLGLAGRRYVEAHHDWNEIAKRLEAIYQEVQ